MNYRPEIDGLRAFAILPVLFFHAGFSWIPGGFLGVDVFFVISGYLISSIIIKEHAAHQFSLAFFYERRARRILPALFFVVSSSLVAAWWLLSPQQLIDFSQSVIATLVFVANIYFWQHIDYFTGDTNLLPLLHLWSLGIEEQFYLLFPLLFILFWSKKPRLIGILAALFVASLLAAQWIDLRYQSAAFYLLPTRAWELLAGAACAFYLYRSPARRFAWASQAGSALALIALIISFICFSPSTHHPSFWTLIPVAATMGIIIFSQPSTYTAVLLSQRPLVWIGLLSYSAYLWHQPLFAFTRLAKKQPDLGLLTTLCMIGLTFALAAISWRWVEQPFRNRQYLSRRSVFIISLTSIAVLVAGMLWLQYHQGYPQRFNTIQRMLFTHQALSAQQAVHDPCFVAEDKDSRVLGESCKINATQPYAMLGDSHASALWYGLVQHYPLAKYTASGCAPLLGDEIKDWRPFCPAINQFNFKEIQQKQPSLVILHANWLLYQSKLPQEDPDLIGKQLANTLAHLQDIAPHTRVVVIGDVPQWPPSLIDILSQHAKTGDTPHELPNATYHAIKQVEQRLQQHMDSQALFISVIDLLCNAQGLCQTTVPVDDTWEPIAWDYGHLSRSGAESVAQAIEARIAAFMTETKN